MNYEYTQRCNTYNLLFKYSKHLYVFKETSGLPENNFNFICKYSKSNY